MRLGIRFTLWIGLTVVFCGGAGCAISHNIQDVSKPADLPPLEDLDESQDGGEQESKQSGDSGAASKK